MTDGNDPKFRRSPLRMLDHDSFAKIMANNSKSALINDHNAPIAECVHPLIYSKDLKNHPDMHTIPVAYSFQRRFYKLFQELKKLPY